MHSTPAALHVVHVFPAVSATQRTWTSLTFVREAVRHMELILGPSGRPQIWSTTASRFINDVQGRTNLSIMTQCAREHLCRVCHVSVAVLVGKSCC